MQAVRGLDSENEARLDAELDLELDAEIMTLSGKGLR